MSGSQERAPAASPVWGAPGMGLPTLEGAERADVCVVGLGAAGLTAVRELQTAGVRVVGVDAGGVGDGASGRNGGFLLAGLAAFHHDAVRALGRERAVRLYRATLDELERTAAGSEGVRRTGSLRIGVSEAELTDCAEQRSAMHADGLPVEPYEGPEGTGLRFPLDAVFEPLARCIGLASAALRDGAALYERSAATRVCGTEVETDRGLVRCSAVLVCVDGGLETVLAELDGTVRTARAQMLATAPDPGVHLPAPVYARWGLDYWQQLPDGSVALGGCRDLGGQGEWTCEAVPTPAVQRALEQLLVHLGVSAPVSHRWAGLIGFARGILPVFAEVREGVIAIGGYRGTGNLVGPLYARAAVRRVLHGDDGWAGLLT